MNIYLKTDTENNLLRLGGYNPLELGKFLHHNNQPKPLNH